MVQYRRILGLIRTHNRIEYLGFETSFTSPNSERKEILPLIVTQLEHREVA